MFVRKFVINTCILFLFALTFNGALSQDPFERMQNQMFTYMDQGKIQLADEMANQLVEKAKKEINTNDPRYAMSYGALGTTRLLLGKTSEAENFLKRAVHLFDSIGYYEPPFLDACQNLSILYEKQENYSAAIAFQSKLIAGLQQYFGKSSKEAAMASLELGRYLYQNGEYTQCEQALRISHQWILANMGVNTATEIRARYNLTTLFLSTNRAMEAENMLTQLLMDLEANKQGLSYYFPCLLAIIESQGLLYKESGVIHYFTQAQHFLDSQPEKVVENEIKLLQVYAKALKNCGAIFSAVTALQKVKILFEEKGTQQSVDYAQTCELLGNIYHSLHNHQSAIKEYAQASNILESLHLEQNDRYTTLQINKALVLEEMENYQVVSGFYEKLITRVDNEYQRQVIVNNYALFLSKHNKPDQAEGLLENECSRLQSGSTSKRFEMLFSLGLIQWRAGKIDQAYQNCIQALKYFESSGLYGNKTLDFKLEFANLLSEMGNKEMAFHTLQQIYESKQDIILQQFNWLNPTQMEAYWKQERVMTGDILTLAKDFYTENPHVVGLAYNAILSGKAVLLESQIIKDEMNDSDRNVLQNQLKSAFAEIAQNEAKLTEDSLHLVRLMIQKDSLEKQYSQTSLSYQGFKEKLKVDWRQVRENLQEGEVAIEFVRIDEKNATSTYQALLLRKDYEHPVWIELVTEDSLRHVLQTKDLGALYDMLWKPLEAHVHKTHTIYYSPSGLLTSVPFHALYPADKKGEQVSIAVAQKRGVIAEKEQSRVADNSEYLMDKYAMRQLLSTRYLATRRDTSIRFVAEKEVFLFGGADFEALPQTKVSKKRNQPSSISKTSGFEYLPGTLAEVQSVSSILRTNHWNVTCLQGKEATEDNIQKMTGNKAPYILHIATHGFAFAEPTSNFQRGSSQQINNRFTSHENPMMRSGLVCAGGNWAWRENDTLLRMGANSNGILTALEISKYDLHKTRLAVLSACETGLGSLNGDEGTFGLARACKQAGVDELIVSLWSVSDKETSEMMTLFYQYISEEKQTIEAFELAQREMRKRYPTQPFLWAGFVFIQ
jgi:CHAT domain-containing protein